MTLSIEQLHAWMAQPSETEHLEFKEAKQQFDTDRLREYCVALANERGGRLVLGVSNALPRRVVGTQAFRNLQGTREELYEALKMCVETEELNTPDGRVVVFDIPSRPIGAPLEYRGRYLMRVGEDVVAMTTEQIQRILAERLSDYSSHTIAGVGLEVLEPESIEAFRARWIRKSGNGRLQSLPVGQLLDDAGVLLGGQVTIAALVLFGTKEAMRRLLPQAEVIFEYRSAEVAGPPQQRESFREGFFGFHDRLWELINLRNDRQSYQEGFFRYDLLTFEEGPVREALLNAVCHRDYQSAGSVFVRQYPRRLSVESPGGFPPGINVENVLDRQLPRNRCIAEALEKCGLVERSGQGMNLIFESAVRSAKALPDFAGTDGYQVTLNLHGEVTDPSFIRYLEKVGAERMASFGTADFLVLAHVQRDMPVPAALKKRVDHLVDSGVIERMGRRLILSRGYYEHAGRLAAYSRKKGLDRETNKSLLLKHLERKGEQGSPLDELAQVLPSLSRRGVQELLQELKREGRASVDKPRRWGKWFAQRS